MTKRKRIEYLETKVDELSKDLDEEIKHRRNLEKELAKMTRLLKHHDKFVPASCELMRDHSWLRAYDVNPELYMYIDDEEYVLELPELGGNKLDKSTITFNLDPDNKRFAIFTIQNEKHNNLYKFTIDYAQGKYLCSYGYIEQKEEAECTDC